MKAEAKATKSNKKQGPLESDVERFCWILARIIARIAQQAAKPSPKA